MFISGDKADAEPMIARPQLTSLTSIKGSGYSKSKSLELSEHYQQLAAPEALKFREVKDWIGFSSMINVSLSQISPVLNAVRYTTMRESLSKYVMPTLLNNKVTSGISILENDTHVIGKADILFANCSNVSRDLILVGLCRPRASLRYDVVRLWATKSRTLLNEFNGNQELDALAAMQSLSHFMALNNVRYGYVASEYYIRFVQLTIEGGSFCDLSVSEPVVPKKAGETIVALCLQGVLCQSTQPVITKFSLLSQSVEHPDVSPLSRYDQGANGKMKWWVAKKNYARKFSVQLEYPWSSSIKLSSSSGDDFDVVSLRRGLFMIDNKVLQPALILISDDEANKLRRIASMLQYLNACATQSVPKFVAFGHLINYRVLVIEANNFESLTHSDLVDPNVVKQLHDALDELHSNGVILGRYDLAAFLVSRNKNQPAIKIIGLDKARLHRNVPKIAQKSEHSRLDWMWMSHFTKRCYDSEQ